MVVSHPDGEWLAALPLRKQCARGGWPLWSLPMNDWTLGGDLLWHAQHPAAHRAMDELVQGFRRLRRPWIWLDSIPRESPGWQALVGALRRGRLPSRETERYEIGQICLRDHRGLMRWEDYQQSWSGNFRRQMRKMVKRADASGGVELRLPQPTDEQQVATLIRQGFQVENQGWKHGAGTSVCCHPRILEFFIEQAQQLHRDGQLQLVFLDYQDQPIAFEYGWVSKGTYYSPKVGYDERYSQLSPGQLLRYYLIAHFLRTAQVDRFDFLGPLSPATAKWANQRYPIRRLICTNGSSLGNLSLRCATALAPAVRRVVQQVLERPWHHVAVTGNSGVMEMDRI